jgi:hypothetical protein
VEGTRLQAAVYGGCSENREHGVVCLEDKMYKKRECMLEKFDG